MWFSTLKNIPREIIYIENRFSSYSLPPTPQRTTPIENLRNLFDEIFAALNFKKFGDF